MVTKNVEKRDIENYYFIIISVITDSGKNHIWMLKSLGKRPSGNRTSIVH